jgi:hypothetical protein
MSNDLVASGGVVCDSMSCYSIVAILFRVCEYLAVDRFRGGLCFHYLTGVAWAGFTKGRLWNTMRRRKSTRYDGRVQASCLVAMAVGLACETPGVSGLARDWVLVWV